MIIDFHTHVYPEKIAQKAIEKLTAVSRVKPHTNGTENELIESANATEIDISVVQPVATNPLKVPNINDVSINNLGKEHIIYFGCMHPDFPDYKRELKRIKDAGIKGIKLHPVSQKTALDDIKYLKILEECGKLDLLALIHAGGDLSAPGAQFSTPRMAVNAVRQVGPVKMIMAHMGGHGCWDTAGEMAEFENIYADTSTSIGNAFNFQDGYTGQKPHMLSGEEFLNLMRAFTADRVLFASDSPWGGQKEGLKSICSLPLSEEEKEKILGGNAVKLLRLDK